MKLLKLSNGGFAKVSDRDYTRVKALGAWQAHKEYSTTYVRHGLIVLHRFILGVTDPKIHVDHRDFDGLNCQRRNLRKATITQSQQHRRKQRNNTSGFKGVYWSKHRSKWRAEIDVRGHTMCLGTFTEPKDAALAYDKAARRYHGRFAITNF